MTSLPTCLKNEHDDKICLFVGHLLANRRPAQAARLAGFQIPSSASVALLAREDVQNLIAAECDKRLRGDGAPAAIRFLIGCVRNKKNPIETRLRAANSILDRAGFGALKAKDPLAPGDAPMQQKSSAQLHKILEDAQRVLSDRAVKVIDTRKSDAQPDTCPPELQA